MLLKPSVERQNPTLIALVQRQTLPESNQLGSSDKKATQKDVGSSQPSVSDDRGSIPAWVHFASPLKLCAQPDLVKLGCKIS